MFGKKPKSNKPKSEDKFATQEHPVIIFQPLSNIPIMVGNLEEKDEYKTEPFLELKSH